MELPRNCSPFNIIPSPAQQIRIYIMHGGARHPVAISDRASVRELKAQIESQWHVEADKQELYHRDGRWLDGGFKLRDLKISPEDEITLKVRSRIWMVYRRVLYKLIVDRSDTVGCLRDKIMTEYCESIEASILLRADGSALNDKLSLKENGIQDDDRIYVM